MFGRSCGGRRRLAEVRPGLQVVGEVRAADPLVANRAVLLRVVLEFVDELVALIILSVVFGGVVGHF